MSDSRAGGWVCPVLTLLVLSPQQFSMWLDSSSPEQTVPYLWSEDSPASKPASRPLAYAFWPQL